MAKKELFRGFSRIFVDEDQGAETQITISSEEVPDESDMEGTPATDETGDAAIEKPPVHIISTDEPKPMTLQQPPNESPLLQVEMTLNRLAERLDTIEAAIGETKHKDDLIRDLHKEMEELKNDFYTSLRRPIIKSIIAIHRRMDERLKYIETKAEEDNADFKTLFVETVKNVRFDRTSVRDTLEDDYDLAYFEPIVGDAYNPKEQNAVNVVDTDDSMLGGTIKDVVCGGFKDVNTGRIWQKANIIVYRNKK